MKTEILAGGLGTRISEESQFVPKPMIRIGEMPVLWHIMKHYSYYGFHDFIICAGYKQEIIKEWFSNYYLHRNDVTFDFRNENQVIVHRKNIEPWTVTVADTGLKTLTGGRMAAVKDYIGNETFMMTYGDGVSDVDLGELVKFHKREGRLATLTGAQPGSRFGVLQMEGNRVVSFQEKNMTDSDWINTGFMVLEPKVFDYIKEDTMFETAPLEQIVKDGELACYRHNGFWQCMDTLRDRQQLEKMWAEGHARWKVWNDSCEGGISG